MSEWRVTTMYYFLSAGLRLKPDLWSKTSVISSDCVSNMAKKQLHTMVKNLYSNGVWDGPVMKGVLYDGAANHLRHQCD
jgi:hypothetical protein